MDSNKTKAVLGLLRISMGLVFLWAFFDKLLGWGFATAPDKSWLAGGSPTAGFLQFGVHGPFVTFFHNLAGSGMVDWLFMLGLLFIGATLTLGIMVRLGSIAGVLMMIMMYLAVGIQPANHPFIDEHFIYALVLLLLMFGNSGKYFGFGNKWYNSGLVQKHKLLA
jgi:thiosulfate dehydrogenase [quinone] large subunit